MKLTAFFLFLSVMAMAAGTYGQETRFDLNVKDATIIQLFDEIEHVTEFGFLFKTDQLDLNRHYTLDLKKANIDQILNEVLDKNLYNYTVIDRNIVITLVDGNAPQDGKSKTVTGKVTDKSGATLPGVSVVVKGTTNGTNTDSNGNYSVFNISENATLQFSFVGMKMQEIVIGSKTTINITLAEDVIGIDEVVAVGYGSISRKEVTSSISSIKIKDIIPDATAGPLNSLQGKITGMTISGGTMQLRGANSINATMGPFVVVDGVPGGSVPASREDIESIDVLKDGSAAAIYGSRASGGVILVTTKKAKEGKVVVQFTSEISAQTIRTRPDVLSADEFLQKYPTATNFGGKTDWFKTISRTPFTHRHNVNFTGGTKNLKVYASVFYTGDKTISKGLDDSSLGGHLGFDVKTLKDMLTISGHFNYVQSNTNGTGANFGMALQLSPTIPAYKADDPTGYYRLPGNQQNNPLAEMFLNKNTYKSYALTADATAKLQVTNDLSTSLMVASNVGNSTGNSYSSPYAMNSVSSGLNGEGTLSYQNSHSNTLEWTANYNKSFDKHNIKLLAGYSYQDGSSWNMSMYNTNFPVPGIETWDMQSGNGLLGTAWNSTAKMNSYRAPDTRLISGFGRINYNFNEKYMLAASIRREGSSKFADGHKWGWFPAASVGWSISNENFMKDISWLNNLKLRAGWGRTGNEGIGAGQTQRGLGILGSTFVNGDFIKNYGLKMLKPGTTDQYVNPASTLQWETKDDFDAGLEFSIFKNRIYGSIDVYDRESNNLIYYIQVPQPPNVYPQTLKNAGSMTNKGIEFELSGVVIDKKDFNYTTTLRFSHNKNTITTLDGSNTKQYLHEISLPGMSQEWGVMLESGGDIGKFYTYKYAGLDADGKWLVYNKTGQPIPYAQAKQEDKVKMGNAIPQVQLSWDNSFTYKNWDASLFFRSWLGYNVMNELEMGYGLPYASANKNVLTSAWGRNANIKTTPINTSYFMQNGNFLKLDAVTIGYNLVIPSIINYISKVRIYATGRNLFCLTSYKGIDPEVNVNGLTPGFESQGVGPQTRIWMLGAQITF